MSTDQTVPLPPPLPPENQDLSQDKQLADLLAQYFGKEPTTIDTGWSFDSTGKVSIPACGQPQFYAAAGLHQNVCVTCDTGAEHSFINELTLASIQGARSRNELKVWPTTTTIMDASGNTMTLLGLALIELEIQGKKTLPIPVLVVPQATFGVLIGQDWLKTIVAADIMYSSDLIVFNKGPWKGCATKLRYRNCKGESASKQVGVYLLANLTVAAKTSAIAPCRLPQSIKSTNCMIEAKSGRNGLLIPRVILETAKQPHIAITNPTNHDITIVKGARLSTATEIHEKPEEPEEEKDSHSSNEISRPAMRGRRHRDAATQVGNYPRTINRESAVRREKLKSKLERPAQMSKEDWKKIENCVLDNNDVFALAPEEITGTTWAKHSIDTGTARPIRCKPRRLVESQKPFVKAEIDKLIDLGWIVPSQSPWASSIVMVRKKNGEWRMCIDFRALNDVTIKDAYRLLNIEEVLDTMQGAKIFTVLDMMSGFHQIPMDERSRGKTAFLSQFGFFEYTTMPFGLANAPAEFQRLADLLLAGIEWRFALCYIDDVVIFSKTVEEHVGHLADVFERFRKANLKLKPAKCRLACSQVQYLGHEISAEGIRPLSSKITAIAEFPTPTSAKEVASFLGVSGFYRKFIPFYSDRSLNLRGLLHKDATFQWTEAAAAEFDDLRKTLTSNPILRYPDFTKMFRLNTDASGYALGAVLEQFDEKEPTKRWMVSCASRSLVQAEKNYSTTDREALAIFWGIKHYRHYLLGRHFVVYTDHKPLLAWRTDSDLEGRRGKWMTKLQDYDFTIYYAKGKENVVPDLLSRWPGSNDPTTNDKAEEQKDGAIVCPMVTDSKADNEPMNDTELNTMVSDLIDQAANAAAMREMQRADPELQPLMQELHEGQEVSGDGRYFLNTDGILCHQWTPKDQLLQRTFTRIVLPYKLRCLTFDAAHERGNHPGFDRLYATLRRRFFWKTMRSDLQSWASWCITCRRRKQVKKKQHTPLAIVPVPKRFERVAVDVVGPLPETADGNRFILVFIDSCTKMVELHALPNVKASKVVKALLDWVSHYGIPKQILSDRGTNFLANITLGMCTALGIKKKNTTAYHPQCNGGVEAFNKTLGDALYYYSREVPTDWDQYLTLIAMHYRMTVHSQTGETPFLLTFGQEAMTPWDVLLGEVTPDDDMTVTQLRQRVQELEHLVQQRLEEQSRKNKIAYDKANKVKPHNFRVGDWVMLDRKARKKGVNKKFTNRNDGPFVVVSEIYDRNLAIKDALVDSAVVTVVNADRLSLFKTAEAVRHQQTVPHIQKQEPLQGSKRKTKAGGDSGASEFVWAKVPGFEPWPARVVTAIELGKEEWPNKRWVKFFNDDGRTRCVPVGRLFGYQEFKSEFLAEASPEVVVAAEELENVAGWDEVGDLLKVTTSELIPDVVQETAHSE